MSAFLQSDAHIATLAFFIYRDCGTAYSQEEIAQILLAENVRSLIHRYGEREQENMHDVRIKDVRMEAKPQEVLVMISGYSYQSCECDDWKQTEAHHLVELLRDEMVSLLTESVDPEFWALK